MNEIGELLKNTRENSGVSLEEASTDLDIKPLILENIENDTEINDTDIPLDTDANDIFNLIDSMYDEEEK